MGKIFPALLLLIVTSIISVHTCTSRAERNLGISNLSIVNSGTTNINETFINGTKPEDWGPDNAPQYNFQKVAIAAGSTVSREEDVNLNALSSFFTMILKYSDGTTHMFRLNQRFVFGDDPGFEQSGDDEDVRVLEFGKTNNHTISITIRNKN